MNNHLTKNTHHQNTMQFVMFTVIAAMVASLAAWGSAALNLEVWVMFVGFIAWFTRPSSLRESSSAMICLWLGIGLAAVAHMITGTLMPSMGVLALPLVVFFVALLVVGLRSTSIVNNMVTWFLGMVTFFAADLEISLETFVYLGSASAIGGFAGYTCQALNRRWAGV